MKPMLAGDYTKAKNPMFPMLGSPKLDGIRALVVDGVVLSRRFIAIPNKHVQKLFGRSAYNGLDGELICGSGTEHDTYGQTESAVMSVEGTPQVTFNVFDDFSFDKKPFHERLYRARSRVNKNGNPNLLLVDHEELKDEADVMSYMEQQLEEGYEGIMLRSWGGPYKYGRSTAREGYLLKLKEFEDAEGMIVGVEELKHNKNAKQANNLGGTKRSGHKAGMVKGGVMGALTVHPLDKKGRRDKDAMPFNLGTGFTAKDRERLWKMHADGKLLGLIVAYRFQRHGMKDRPRIPSFKGFRSRVDL